MEIVEQHVAAGGTQTVFTHVSAATTTPMRVAVFTPPQHDASTPVLVFLSGLTCTEQNVITKGGFQTVAAELGLIVVCPDTSPRGEGVADSPDYDLGQGAGFYLDATQAPWSPHFRMETYVTEELPQVVAGFLGHALGPMGITGHSMGGHGALTLALRHPALFRSVSAFAPIASPTRCPWGHKALNAYLGGDPKTHAAHDATALLAAGHTVDAILVDQGTNDPFLDEQLKPDLLVQAAAVAGVTLTLRKQQGYDHSYYFVATFLPDHLRWHAERLTR